jgi:hypothetical protein
MVIPGIRAVTANRTPGLSMIVEILVTVVIFVKPPAGIRALLAIRHAGGVVPWEADRKRIGSDLAVSAEAPMLMHSVRSEDDE